MRTFELLGAKLLCFGLLVNTWLLLHLQSDLPGWVKGLFVVCNHTEILFLSINNRHVCAYLCWNLTYSMRIILIIKVGCQF